MNLKPIGPFETLGKATYRKLKNSTGHPYTTTRKRGIQNPDFEIYRENNKFPRAFMLRLVWTERPSLQIRNRFSFLVSKAFFFRECV